MNILELPQKSKQIREQISEKKQLKFTSLLFWVCVFCQIQSQIILSSSHIPLTIQHSHATGT